MIARFTSAAAVFAAALAAQPPGFKLETPVQATLQLSCAMAFAPDGRLFVTERNTGVIRVLEQGRLSGVWARVDAVAVASTEAGLLGIAVDPDFLRNRHVYVFHTRTSPQWANAVTRLTEVNGAGVAPLEIVPAFPATGNHCGGPIEVGSDGRLYVCAGEAGMAPLAQSLGNPFGKVLRVERDGSVPLDNPFAGRPGLEGRIWSYGHRNPFGLTVSPVHGLPFATENSAFRGDELNLIVRGGNYGWPLHEGAELWPDPMCEDPVRAWVPDPSLTGACVYTGGNYPAGYRLALFVTNFNRREVVRLTLDAAHRAVTAESVFHVHAGTVLDVADGPDGNLWVLYSDQRLRGCDSVGRYVHDQAPRPALHLMAVSNQAVGGSVTLGVTGSNGDAVLWWLALRKLPQALPTPFGELWVPLDFQMPARAIVADERAYLGVPVPALPGLRGARLFAQAATFGAAGLRLTPPSEMLLW
jgi:glucose/arabinose dehydrogenase